MAANEGFLDRDMELTQAIYDYILKLKLLQHFHRHEIQWWP